MDYEGDHICPRKILKIQAGDIWSSSQYDRTVRIGEKGEMKAEIDEGETSQEADVPTADDPAGLVPSIYSLANSPVLDDASSDCWSLGSVGYIATALPSVGEGIYRCELEAGVEPNNTRRSLYDELASMDELMEDESDSGEEDDYGDDADYKSAQYAEPGELLSLKRESLQEKTAGGLLIVCDDLDEDEWFDAEDGMSEETPSSPSSSIGNTSSSPSSHSSISSSINNAPASSPPSSTSSTSSLFGPVCPPRKLNARGTARPAPLANAKPCSPRSSTTTRPTQKPTVQRLTFSPEAHRYAGALGSVAPVAITPLSIPTTSPSQHLPQSSPVMVPSIPTINLIPPTPRYTTFELFPRYRRTTDTTRLYVRERDREVKGARARREREVQERWELVKRRRGRYMDALGRRLGGLDAWRRVRVETAGWDEWASSGRTVQ